MLSHEPSTPSSVSVAADRKSAGNRLEAFRTFALNASLIVAKTHLFCCAVFPLAANFIGGTLGKKLHSETAELVAGLIVSPLITYGVMAFEQKRHNRTNHHCDHDHKILTPKKFLFQAALGYGMFFGAHALLDHDHQQKPQPHNPIHSTTTKGNNHVLSFRHNYPAGTQSESGYSQRNATGIRFA